VQAWHPDSGWVGIDPTNNKLVDWQYVRAAIGRDYYDVQPVRGVFYGEAEQQLTIEVRVTRLGS
jgi:transglutaminase-like putative cysteine protease